MGSEEVPTSWQNEDSTDAISPHIGVLLMADVCVVQYTSSQSLGDFCGKKCTIVTSLNAVFKASSNSSVKAQDNDRNKGDDAVRITSPLFSKEGVDHPVVRRSKKHTQLNKVNMSEFTSKRAQIDRTVLLPYLGCTKRFGTFGSPNTQLLLKHSKSCETTGKSNKDKNLKPFRSQILFSGSPEKNSLNGKSLLGHQDMFAKEQLGSQEYDVPNAGFNNLNEAVRSYYLIKTPTSGPRIYAGNEYNRDRGLRDGQQPSDSTHLTENFPDKRELYKNISGFEEGIIFPSAKTTRNVSILHRPKTREKATSTTSLDELNLDQNLHKSIQGLLLPFIANGRDFPSEIVLKLVPKAEAMKGSFNDTGYNKGGSNSSEVNLLAPRLNTVTVKEKKKGGGSFWNCFSNTKKKNADPSTTSLGEDYTKETYYPSVVEVHNKKPTKSLNGQDSALSNSDTSFYTVSTKTK